MNKIVRMISLLLVLAFSLMLYSCGEENKTSSSDNDEPAVSGVYGTGGIFDTSFVHKIEVEISDEDWDDLKKNPLNKTKYETTVTIDGEKISNVSFATKGNTSLSMVASSDSDRYSFKLNFGKFKKGQTYKGIDKLNLNNMMSDATYMKDYISYMIMREAGVKAPLTSYAELYVNNELHGLYIVIENVSDSFLERNYDDEDGVLYKPESKMLANIGNGQKDNTGMPSMPNGQMPDGQIPSMPNGQMPDGQIPSMPNGQMPDGQFPSIPNGQMPDGQIPSMPNGQMPDGQAPGMPGGFGDGDNKGTDLVYTDDNEESYEAIFENAETDITDDDKKELIAALKSLSTGEDIESHWDIDQVIKYFVAHNFVLNYDSYTGNMLHNYYLYESDGKVTILPWDYNLAFCGFTGGTDATSAVNWAVDSPLSGTTEDARPLWNVIVNNSGYLEKYHQYFSELISSFFESGKCEKEIVRIYDLIKGYVKNDPSAFYKYDQFETAYQTLKEFCKLRAKSIRKQLDGKLGKTSSDQKREDMVDASDLELKLMGSQGGEKGGENNMPGQGGSGQNGQPGMPGQGGPGMNGQPGMPGQGGSGQNGQPGWPGQGGSQMPDQNKGNTETI